MLTIVGYSMNDTVVVYDRIRENLGKHRARASRDSSTSASPRCSAARSSPRAPRCSSVLAFFFWGTGVIKDFAFALLVGIIVGTYSSIYVAAPLTEWIDRRCTRAGVGPRP